MNRERLLAIIEAADADAVHADDGAYLDWSTGVLEVGDADGNVVQLPLSALAIAVLNQ